MSTAPTGTHQARTPGRAARLAPGLASGVLVGASRLGALAAALVVVGALPWLSGRDPALAVLRARSEEQVATPEALASVRQDLGLAPTAGGQLLRWASGVVRGDLGTSWVSGRPVLPDVLGGLAVSLTLMAFAIAVAAVVAALLVAPALRAAVRGGATRSGGAVAALLTSLPEFLLATALLVVVAVHLRWLPPYGWEGPHHAVLPALALGLPAGGLLGRLLADAVSSASAEPWVATWTTAGTTRGRLVGGLLLRAVPGVAPQVGMVLVGLAGGAVPVERVFAIPGIGRTSLGAAAAQDAPLLQACVLALLVVGVVCGAGAALLRRVVLGRALRTAGLSVAEPEAARGWGARAVPVCCALLLVAVTVSGLLRDPFTPAHGRLQPPSLALPLGADASGRDLLARVGHGAASTVGTAVLVCALAAVVGIAAGLLPRLSTGPVEVANAAPPVLAGLVTAAVLGPGGQVVGSAAIAVLAVSWAPLAAHTAALVTEARAQPHVRVLPLLGVGRARLLLVHVLPDVLPPVLRHAALRLPGIALALASLGFLGLGPQPPAPDWGLVLAEGMPYVERAPWAVLAPAASLVALSVLAVTLSSLGGASASSAPGLGRAGSAGSAGRWRRAASTRAALASGTTASTSHGSDRAAPDGSAASTTDPTSQLPSSTAIPPNVETRP
ncbi:peptide/nickel transport system permease protein [Quadrisphaera granulorum]|uniref:Peptide/nickel transport system permease protein n=1 Tax=Quadrisphaera granulorum TaxID=317664 RepID=A0A316AKY5_9ACTN|nr:peptide/nickel transport system permease protein [Quadrisphaera granulorum]SZE97935.1 peptide/nickel transport system permease protein [Quadrisphaera granulorum]